MKFANFFKHMALVVLALGIAAGCASTSKMDEQREAAAQAIAEAKALVQEAKSLGAEWQEADGLLMDAEKSFAAEDYAMALEQANKAKQKAEMVIAQWYRSQAEEMIAKAKSHSLNAEQMALLEQAEAALRHGDYKRAYHLAKQLLAALAASDMRYTVVRGDSLWKISGKGEVYNNPYQWPLIYKRNSGQIRDADLIYPKQVLNVERNPSSADVNAAVHHARTRGAWAVGPVEESDKRYLGR